MKKIYFISALFLCSSASAQTPVNSLNFDGTNDYVSTSLPAVFNNIATNDFTVETWVKPNGAGTQRICFAQLDNTHFFSILLNSSNTPYVYVYNGGGNGYNTGVSLTTGVWSHLSVSWDASASQADIYINGVLTAPVGGGSSSTGSNNVMCIGSRSDGTQNLQGELDEFKIWDYYRTQCDVLAGMNSEYDMAQPNLVAYYNFNQGTPGGTNTGITTLPDFTSNYDGTLINFGLSGATSNWQASGAGITAINQSSGSFSTSYAQDICLGDTIYLGTQTLAMTGIFVETFLSVAGCDSIVTVDLTVHDTMGVSSTATSCGDYIWAANGMTYSVSGNYTETLTSIYGCDSVVTLDLTVNSVNSGATLTGITLTADQAGAVYQWLDCDNAYATIPGETNQSFTPTANGQYAVQVTDNGCTDTSACMSVTSIGIIENQNNNLIFVYPNPTKGLITLNVPQQWTEYSVIIRDAQGKLVSEISSANQSSIDIMIEGDRGIYFIEVFSQEGSYFSKIVLE